MFKKLYGDSKILLSQILDSDNPVNMLGEMFEKCSYKEDEKLRSLMRDLSENRLIKTQWGDNVPYHIEINNSARTYFEREKEYEEFLKQMNNKTYSFSGNTQFIETNNGTAIQNNGLNVDELDKLISYIKLLLTDEIPQEQREMINDNIEAIQEELKKDTPKKGFLKTAWNGIQNVMTYIPTAIALIQELNKLGEFVAHAM